jgi:rubrerythrin
VELKTAASVISYVTQVERESSAFYEKWADRHEELRETFLAFSKENFKNEKIIKRSYFSVVSDALETNFCFRGLETNIEMPSLRHDTSLTEILKATMALEDEIKGFYEKAADSSSRLLADVPGAMRKIARSRVGRMEKLNSMMMLQKDTKSVSPC